MLESLKSQFRMWQCGRRAGGHDMAEKPEDRLQITGGAQWYPYRRCSHCGMTEVATKGGPVRMAAPAS